MNGWVGRYYRVHLGRDEKRGGERGRRRKDEDEMNGNEGR